MTTDRQDAGDASSHAYARLSPDVVLDAIERYGLACTGALTPLNSYENRVYLADVEPHPRLGNSIVAKFYRPNRWSDPAILEEHEYASELAAREIPVVAPIKLGGSTLLEHAGFRVAVYPRIRGYAPEIDRPEILAWVGRFLGRIHAVGATRHFCSRPRLDVDTLGHNALSRLLDTDLLPIETRSAYERIARKLLQAVEARLQALAPRKNIRLHGDCHAGNILWAPDGPYFVDLDDCRSGPAVQDLWMLLSGRPDEMESQLGQLLGGYRQFHEFDHSELTLIEPLRALRAVNYASWLANRWSDPAFPRAFPWFGTARYWEDQTQQLYGQLDRLDNVLSPAYI